MDKTNIVNGSALANKIEYERLEMEVAWRIMHEQVTIEGVTYDVKQAHTPETLDAAGLVNTARQLRAIHASRDLYLQRPRSRGVTYSVIEFIRPNGKRHYGRLVSLGR